MRRRVSTVLLGLALALASFSPLPREGGAGRNVSLSDDPARDAAEEQALNAAVTKGDVGAVLDLLRRRTPPEEERQALVALVRDLADDSFEVRQTAADALLRRGPRASAFLRRAARGTDPEAAHRALACLSDQRPDFDPTLLASAVRLTRRAPPADAAAVLLGYLPFVADDAVLDEVRAALASLAEGGAEPLPRLVQALTDPDPLRRGVSAEVLCRADAAYRPRVRALLADPDVTTRLLAARALLEAGERDAVPALIDLLAELPPEERWSLEDRLAFLAEDDTPSCPRDDRPGTARRCRDAWAAWWTARGVGVDLARLRPAPTSLGLTLHVWLDLPTLEGAVLERAPDGKPLWRIDDLRYPISAQVLPDDRVVIAEYETGRVSERRFSGDLLWEKAVGGNVVAAQRFDGGRTFVACRNRLLEIAPDGQVVVRHVRPVRDVVAARVARNGEVIFLTHDGVCRRLDARGAEVKRFAVEGPVVMGAGIDLLPGRRVLVPEHGRDRVAEYDAEGNLLWQAAVAAPSAAQRLPNGHTLVTSTATHSVVDVDRAGHTVAVERLEATPVIVTRR